MIKGWKPGLTLERRNNELGYFKDNCYWATRKQQARNRRSNCLITAFGKTQCIVAWSEETGIPESTIRWQITHGWTSEKVLMTPVKKQKKRRKKNERNY